MEDKTAEKVKKVKTWCDKSTGKIFFLQGIPRNGWTKWEVWSWDKRRGNWETIKAWDARTEKKRAREWLQKYAKDHDLEPLDESEIHNEI
jgi:hypothetical protein